MKMLGFVILILSCVAFSNGEDAIEIQKIYRHSNSLVKKDPMQVDNDNEKLTAQKISGVTFLIAVNDTWGNCISTVRTPMLKANVPANESERILVGNCDSGPLTYSIGPGTKGDNVTINLTFYSSVIEDASPPTCSIPFSGTFLTPSRLAYPDGTLPSLLPGCSTMDSREGYHMTYYWFYIYDVLFS